MTGNVYVFDTSSFIELKNLSKYADVLVSLWTNLDRLVRDKRLISPKKVHEDLNAGIGDKKTRKDELMEWIKSHEQLFQDENNENFLIELKAIANKYHGTWIDTDSGANESDPYVIALAKSKQKEINSTLFPVKVLVVTEESQDLNRLKIPRVCNETGVKYLNLHQLFNLEGWKF